MAKIGKVQNGLKKKSNGTTKRKPLTLAKVSGFLKQNGLKAVKRGVAITATASNGTKKKKGKSTKKKKNGLTSLTSRNGLLGNTKSDAKKVGSLLGGLLGGKALGRVVNGFAAPYLTQVGLGGYSEVISDGLVALVAVPMIAGKVAGSDAASLARLGALANVAVDVIEMVAPNTLSIFGANPVISNGSQVGLTPAAVSQLVASTSASVTDKQKIAGVMQALERGASVAPASMGMTSPASVMPLYE